MQQSQARTLFAFSRDRLVPFSHVWTRINPLTGTPLYAVWISVILCIAINLVGLGSYAAIAGVFNITAIALDWSYCIPIICKLAFGQFEPGPWNLGKASIFINAWAVIWTLFVSIIFILPTVRPVTALTMNYAAAFLGLIFFFATIYWYIRGKNFYTGPLVEAIVDESDSQNSREKAVGEGYGRRDNKETIKADM